MEERAGWTIILYFDLWLFSYPIYTIDLMKMSVMTLCKCDVIKYTSVVSKISGFYLHKIILRI